MSDDIITILNLNKSNVQNFYTTRNQQNLHLHIQFIRDEFICKTCKQKLYIKDYKLKIIKHQIIRDMDTTIHYSARRYLCKNCNSTHFEKNPFTSRNYNFSQIMIVSLLKYLKEPTVSFSLAARQYNISTSRVVSLFDDYCQMVKRPLTRCICIDEFYAIRTSKEKYVCIILDFDRGTILDVMFGRTKINWSSYTQLIPKKELDFVEYISIDMYETYRIAAKKYFKNAKVCIDSFHVIKNINQLLKRIRIDTMKRYPEDSNEYYLLKNFNWLIMMDGSKVPDNIGKYNKKLGYVINYTQILELILAIDPILKHAYELKEDYLLFNATSTLENARDDLSTIISIFTSSEIETYQHFADTTLIKWFDEIVNSFTLFNGRRISNGPIESTNSRVKTILKVSNGFKNFSRMRNKIMYSLNKDSCISPIKNKQIIKRKGKPRGPYNKI